MGGIKGILVHKKPAVGLEAHLAGLDLPRRALSLPVPGAPNCPVAAFVELWGSRDELFRVIGAWPAEASAWLVDENLVADYERTWPSGSESPGVRMVSSVHRLSGLDRVAFVEYWRTKHAAVALSYTVPVWRYSQNVVVESLEPDASEDGFAVLHFRTAEELKTRWTDYPEEARRGAQDAACFMDVDRSWSATMVETAWEGTGGSAAQRAAQRATQGSEGGEPA